MASRGSGGPPSHRQPSRPACPLPKSRTPVTWVRLSGQGPAGGLAAGQAVVPGSSPRTPAPRAPHRPGPRPGRPGPRPGRPASGRDV